ncbi:prepilin-type N-terminal cleavage/methylation domain-containing protein [bacterium]|nr:prepilin-type N-terminal cleavage/methylation domain-containing protein [bacterium]
MRVSSATHGNRPSSGYTLLEVMLAVSVLVILATVASTPVMRTWRDQRLASSAENVRSLLAGSRIRAVDYDETWQFRYEPGGTHYVRVPLNPPASDGDESPTYDGPQSGTLPNGVTFETDDTGSAPPLDSKLIDALSDAQELSAASWATPILFYSDGTANQAEFRIVDQYGGSREISVRDLTGAVTSRRTPNEE